MDKESAAPDVSRYYQSETQISWLTLILGAIAALAVSYWYEARFGAGILVGAVLAWLNFRWLKQGLDALTESATAQANQAKPHVPVGIYFRAVFRYLLIALAIYVIFEVLKVPVLSMIFGLCALGAATFSVSVYEILHPPD